MAPDRPTGLGLRILSAVVLAPPVLAAVYFGSPYVEAVVLLGGGLAAWEWARLCGGVPGLPGVIAIAAVVAAVAAGAVGAYTIAGWLAAVGTMGAVLAAARGAGDAVWLGLGVAYLAAACLAFLWLRQDPLFGRTMVLWLIAVVWATDIGAYFAGRAIGGPRLAPAISPKKTWAGLLGGMAAAAAVGAVACALRDQANYAAFTIASAALAIVAQLGDLFESSLKRRFGAKDASHLIPGHGGVLDRVDGILAAALVLGAFITVTEVTI